MSYSVVFDVGGVLVPEGNRMERLQHFARQTLGEFEPSEFTAAYWEFRNDYDLGSSDEEFWGRVFTRAGVREYDDSDVAAVAARDAELNSTISSDAEVLLQELSQRDIPMAILSNAPLRMAHRIAGREWAKPVRAMTFSSEHGVMKPDPAIYEVVVRTLSSVSEPADIVFFDDREKNITAAREAGWTAHQWVSVAEARQFLVELGVLPRS